MENGVIDGGLLRLYISSDGGTTFKTGYMDVSADLSITHSLKDSKTKDSGNWDEMGAGTYSWSISGEKLFTVIATTNADVTQDDIIIDDLLDLMIPDFDGVGEIDCEVGKISQLLKIKYSTPQGLESGGFYYEGEAYLVDVSISAGNEGDNSTASYSLTGIGPLTKKTTI
tara:strand:+ start:15961 stop:16470 length:510 start_codon:yes stop_codon:yes gene_type:complete